MAYKTLGIIPAGGAATRFGGLMKELLPDKGGYSLLERTVSNLKILCDEVVVISNPARIAEHARVLGNSCLFRITDGYDDMWRGITAGLKIPADFYWFLMPDTIVNFCGNKLPSQGNSNFRMGLFRTNYPHRFGCLHLGEVVNKSKDVPTPALAWGCLGWGKKAVELWNELDITDYTQAINVAIEYFGLDTFRLESYYDMASIDYYLDYLDNSEAV
jgi:hypothetical protein